MINYKNNFSCTGVLLLMLITAGCTKNEAALEPSNKDENLLVVQDNPNDPVEHAVYELYKSTGIPVFYTDTVARRQVGDSAGIPQYFYTKLMLNYSPSTGEGTNLAYTLLTKDKRTISMVDLLKNELLTVLPPLPSIFLTDSLFVPMPVNPVIRDAHVGFNTVAIRSVDPDTMTADAKSAYVLAILTRVGNQKLDMLKKAQVETDFHSITMALSPWIEPYHVTLEEISDGTQTYEDFGFISTVESQNKIFTPEKTRDVEAYLKAVFLNTTDAFNTTYAAYPAVLKKFAIMRSILTDLKFKLPG